MVRDHCYRTEGCFLVVDPDTERLESLLLLETTVATQRAVSL